MTKIIYKVSPITESVYRTNRFVSLIGDTFSGQVDSSIYTGTREWSGWFFNHSNKTKTEFRLGFKSKGAATRWVNRKLREYGLE